MSTATAPVEVVPPEEAAPAAAPALCFDRVVVACAANVVVRPADACSVEIDGPEADVARMKIEIVEGVLKLSGTIEAGEQVTVRIQGPNLWGVIHRGSGRLEVVVDLSPKLTLTHHGDGELVAMGRAAMLRATLTGRGDMRLQELTATRAWLVNHGHGNIHAVVTRDMRVEPIGPGAIKVNEHLKKPSRR